MFLHIGKNIVIPLEKIISIYDIKNKKDIVLNKKKIKDISEGTFKSCIVTDDTIYVSSISAATLYNRSRDSKFLV